jgi:hypothetical protein
MVYDVVVYISEVGVYRGVLVSYYICNEGKRKEITG